MGVIVSNGLHQFPLISLKPTTTNKTSSFHIFVDLWKCGRLATVVVCGAGGTSDLFIFHPGQLLICVVFGYLELKSLKTK